MSDPTTTVMGHACLRDGTFVEVPCTLRPEEWEDREKYKDVFFLTPHDAFRFRRLILKERCDSLLSELDAARKALAEFDAALDTKEPAHA